MGNLTHAVRQLLRSPGFTVVAVTSLALGIGVNTAIFSLVNAVLFRPLPVHEPERLAMVFKTGDDSLISESPLSFPDYEDYRDNNEAFEGLSGYALQPVALDEGTESRFVMAELVTGNYFQTMGVGAALGRVLLPEDDVEGGSNNSVVLNYSTWKKRWAADPGAVGSEIRLNGHPFTIVGVAQSDFHGATKGFAPELWFPAWAQPQLNSGSRHLDRRANSWLFVMGRLKSGATVEQAQQQLQLVARGLSEQFPESHGDRGVVVFPANEVKALLPVVNSVLYIVSAILMAVVGLVLLIACANVANMLLARAAGRRREIAIRLSLGAGRVRLVRQLLLESSLLAVTAAAAGLLIAYWSNVLLSSIELPLPVELELGLQMDWRVFGFAALAAVATTLLFGLVPALQASKTDLTIAMKDESAGMTGGRSRNRLRSMLVVAQVALSLVLLIGAGLSMRSLQNAHLTDPGFEPHQLVAGEFAPELQGYDDDRAGQFFQQLKERMEASPGVESVSLSTHFPLTFEIRITEVASRDLLTLPEDRWPNFDVSSVGPGYLETMRIPLISGREFNDGDRQDAAPVVMVNRAAAETLWPAGNAVGQQLFFSQDGDPHEVVGVVANGKYRTLGEDSRPFVYRSLQQTGDGSQTVIVRAAGDLASTLGALRTAASEIDARVPIVSLRTVEDAIGAGLILPQVTALVFGLFGALGLVLATVGLYGVISYTAARRTHEVGIRTVLGAGQSDILRLVIGQGVRLTAIGIIVGLAAAWGVTRFISAVLYGVSATDPLTFVAVSAVALATAIVACYVPARRATRVDPMTALRYE